MKKATGLWIDHREAIIVTVSDEGEKTQHVQSNVEKEHGRVKGTRSTAPFESQLVQADDRQQRSFTKHLHGFYEEVFSCIDEAESLFIFGPGEAKSELKRLVEHHNHHDRVVVMEAADKMTEKQIAAKVHRHFHPE